MRLLLYCTPARQKWVTSTCRLFRNEFRHTTQYDPSNVRRTTKRDRHSIAIARQLPSSFPNAISSSNGSGSSNSCSGSNSTDDGNEVVDMVRAKQQHTSYIEALRLCLPVLELPALGRPSSSSSSSSSLSTVQDEAQQQSDDDDSNAVTTSTQNDCPDCAFVEDTVVAIGQYALITRMGHISRRGESETMYSTLQQLGMNVLNMNDYYNTTDWIYGKGRHSITGGTIATDAVRQGELAIVDGGDVLYTGRHIFVGLSNRTNIEGAIFIKQYFSSYEVIVVPPIVVDPSIQLPHPMPLHLKSAVTHIDSATLLAPVGPYGDLLLESMNVKELDYKVYRVPDLLSCNVIACNGQIIVQDTACQQSQDILYEAVMDSDHDLIRVDTSELAKKDAALTCCSVLLEA
jgi:dimethylargininase